MNYSEYLSRIKRHFLSQKLSGVYRSEAQSGFLVFFFLVGVLNLLFGILVTLLYSGLYEVSIPYSSDMQTSVYLPAGRIYFFLEMEDFYQANLRYSKSISYPQLQGETPKSLKSADPLDYLDGKPIYPAGLLPNSFPQDEFSIDGLDIQVEDIAWKSEMDHLKPPGYTRDEVVPPPLWQDYVEIPNLSINERFVNWIYIAPFSSFRKLWGIVDVEDAGNYMLNVQSHFPYGRKNVTFAQSSAVGPRNYFLSVGMAVVGGSIILMAFLAYAMGLRV